jgi:hypothetical protein
MYGENVPRACVRGVYQSQNERNDEQTASLAQKYPDMGVGERYDVVPGQAATD